MSLIDSLRSYRLGGFAIFDFVAALYGTALLAEQFGYRRVDGYVAAIPLGVAVHWALGINTPLNRIVLGN